MLNMVTEETIATEIEMTKDSFPGTILVIEGKNDTKFYDKFVDPKKCHLVVAHGKDNVLAAIEIINRDNIAGVAAIVDSDFWRVTEIPALPRNIFVTDTHDSEGMIFTSNAFDRIAKELCTEKKINEYDDLRGFIYSHAKQIGFLRLASIENDLFLVFEGLDYKKATRKNTIVVDIDSLIRHLQHLTKKNAKRKDYNDQVFTDEEIKQYFEETVKIGNDFDVKEVCCGHDLIGLFAIGLRRLFASIQATTANREHMEKVFRLAYSYDDFKDSDLYSSITEWENNHQHKILV